MLNHLLKHTNNIPYLAYMTIQESFEEDEQILIYKQKK